MIDGQIESFCMDRDYRTTFSNLSRFCVFKIREGSHKNMRQLFVARSRQISVTQACSNDQPSKKLLTHSLLPEGVKNKILLDHAKLIICPE